MKRLLVNLDDDTHEALRRLAFEKNTQMAKLVRFAIDKTFEDDLDGILGEMGLEEHLRDPSGSMTIPLGCCTMSRMRPSTFAGLVQSG